MADQWTVIALTAPGRPIDIAAWLQQYGPFNVTIGPGIAPKVLRARFFDLPSAWTKLLSSLNVQHVALTPDGCASLFIEDSLQRISHFTASLGGVWPAVRSRPAHRESSKPQLTHRQEEALSLAVALGYYELPHKLNLRELGRRMNLSVGAVSELLRRAEAQLVTSHVDNRAFAQWDSLDAPVQVPLPLLAPIEPNRSEASGVGPHTPLPSIPVAGRFDASRRGPIG